ncbi:MAG: TonB family protein [Caldithrix sp.]|nr:TonB family protein [Caldithrix sp.]
MNHKRTLQYKGVLYPFLLCIAVVVIFLHSVRAQSVSISGQVITGDENWAGEVELTGDVVIDKGGRLFINPGTQVVIHPNRDDSRSGNDPGRTEIIVKGVLVARGDIDNKIVFTSSGTKKRMGDWLTINISNPSEVSVIMYTVIEYAYNGITLKYSNPQIRNSIFRYNYNAGLSIEVKAKPILEGNIISENGYAGIICKLGANPKLTDNMIAANQVGMITFSLSKANLGFNSSDENANRGENVFIDNRDYHFYNHTNQDIWAENNSWGTKDRDLIAEMIFDGNDEAGIGMVDFLPFKGARQPAQDKILLAQESGSNPEDGNSNPAQTGRDSLSLRLVTESGDSVLQQDSVLMTGNGINIALNEQTDTTNTENREITSGALSLNTTSTLIEPEVQVKQKQAERQRLSINYDQVFQEPLLDEPKQVIFRKVPMIENEHVSFKAEGKVIVNVIVNKEGRVESVRILRSLNPYYDDLALEAAKEFIFERGTINGIPVRFSTNLLFKFNE